MRNEIELSYILPVFFNQKDTLVLDNLLRLYSTYDPEIISKIEFVIVDDCSPLRVIVPENINLNFQLFNIETDIRWNQAGARNLGVSYASAPKIIITDCDHVFPEILFKKILKSRIPKRTLFKFRRSDENNQRIISAFNIFYTSKSVFFSSLGYDEEFCGHYGHEDSMFRAFQKRLGNRIRCFSWNPKIISPVINREHSYHSLIRDTQVNEALLKRKLEWLNGPDFFKAHSRRFLNFDFKKVAENFL